MRKTRFIGQNRCYHLVSRLAHRAFFLDDEEKDRAVALMRRVEEFSGVVILAYAFMSDHFHIFIYVPGAEEINEEEMLRRIRVLCRDASLSQVVATWNRLKDEERELCRRARPTEHPEDYRWCSFAAAVHGDGKARAGYGFMYGGGEWRILRECHEKSMREAMGDVLKTRGSENGERPSDCGAGPVDSKACPRLDMPGEVGIGLARGREKTAKKILDLLADGPMRPSALREAVGIRSRIHFSRYYLMPLLEKGLVKRTYPDNPMSPMQEYKLA